MVVGWVQRVVRKRKNEAHTRKCRAERQPIALPVIRLSVVMLTWHRLRESTSAPTADLHISVVAHTDLKCGRLKEDALLQIMTMCPMN